MTTDEIYRQAMSFDLIGEHSEDEKQGFIAGIVRGADWMQRENSLKYRQAITYAIMSMKNRGIFRKMVNDNFSTIDFAECVMQHVDLELKKLEGNDNK